MVNTIAALAAQLGKPAKSHSGAPCWGGHAMRRGGAQYLAAAGVDIWRIQALARHSSAAVLLYIEKAHVPTLKSISVGAASGRKGHALAVEVAKLKDLLGKHLRPQAVQTDTITQTSLDETNSKWICVNKQGSKVHTKSKTYPGKSLCEWPWALAPNVIQCNDQFGPPNDYRRTCIKCTRAEQ